MSTRVSTGISAAVAAATAASLAVSLALVCCSCSRTRTGEADTLVLAGDVHGFRLGERRSDLFRRAEGNVRIERAPSPRGDYRGELYELSGTIKPLGGIDHVRLAFLDDRLMEVIVYFTDTSMGNLETLRGILEMRYDAKAVAPDGTVETVWKTYRLSAPGMSVTLRRIAKREGIELYIQYLHEGLHRKLIERQKGR